jgi:hypothetical protein
MLPALSIVCSMDERIASTIVKTLNMVGVPSYLLVDQVVKEENIPVNDSDRLVEAVELLSKTTDQDHVLLLVEWQSARAVEALSIAYDRIKEKIAGQPHVYVMIERIIP